jgi:hypothetical protein
MFDLGTPMPRKSSKSGADFQYSAAKGGIFETLFRKDIDSADSSGVVPYALILEVNSFDCPKVAL